MFLILINLLSLFIFQALVPNQSFIFIIFHALVPEQSFIFSYPSYSCSWAIFYLYLWFILLFLSNILSLFMVHVLDPDQSFIFIYFPGSCSQSIFYLYHLSCSCSRAILYIYLFFMLIYLIYLYLSFTLIFIFIYLWYSFIIFIYLANSFIRTGNQDLTDRVNKTLPYHPFLGALQCYLYLYIGISELLFLIKDHQYWIEIVTFVCTFKYT